MQIVKFRLVFGSYQLNIQAKFVNVELNNGKNLNSINCSLSSRTITVNSRQANSVEWNSLSDILGERYA